MSRTAEPAGVVSGRLREEGMKTLRAGQAISLVQSFPGGADGKAAACNVGGPGWIPRLGRSSEEGNGYPLPHSCFGIFRGWRTLVGWYSPRGGKESDATERLHFLIL